MRVFVTGATGLVGAHTTLALLAAGHEVRLLARDVARARGYFRDHGHDVHDVVEADMRDVAAVRDGLAGCDAVVHAAAMVSVDPTRASELFEANAAGIEAVVRTAARLGIGRILYVSSLGAFFRPGATAIDETSPLGESCENYLRSKQHGELAVRRLQEEGAPILVTYPGGVFAPDDPKLSEANRALLAFLRVVPQTTSGMQFVDGRDLARAHVRLLERTPPRDPTLGRYIVGGHFVRWAEIHALLERVTGARIFAPWSPGWLLRAMGVAMDGVRRFRPIEFPMTRESMAIATRWAPASSARVVEATGVVFRPPEETVRDTLRWLAAAGHVSGSGARLARLAALVAPN